MKMENIINSELSLDLVCHEALAIRQHILLGKIRRPAILNFLKAEEGKAICIETSSRCGRTTRRRSNLLGNFGPRPAP